MKQDWKSLPPALQHQLIIQMGLAVCCLVLAIGALAFISFSVSVPFLLGAALLTICAARLYRTGMRGQYLILRGVILKVERTVLRQRPKSILLEANGKALLVMLRNRHAAVREGDTVTLYIADTAPLYEWQGSTDCMPTWRWCRADRTGFNEEKWFTIFLITASRAFGIGTVFPFLMMILSAL